MENSALRNIVWGNQREALGAGCVEPEVLAAYADRGLSVVERERVEAHLASCPQCLSLLAGVVRTAVEVSEHTPSATATADARPRVVLRNLVGVLSAAAAVLAVLFVPSLRRSWADRDAGLVSLVETVGSERSVLGRLTGGFPHAPLGAPSAGGQDGRVTGSDQLVLIADKIRESFGERQTPSRLHAMGVSQLLLGRYDEAARSLVAASREQPDNAQYLNDVATVQLERARRGLRPDDLPRALAAADRARRLDPSLNEAWFNRALAMSALSLTDQAKQAWTEYLSRDSVSPWAAEARTRLNELARPTPAAMWSGIAQGLANGIDAAEADAAVRAQTTEARHYIIATLLPSWAVAIQRGESGALELDRVRVMSEAMLRNTGDALFHDAIAAIDRSSGADRSALATAHVEFARAADRFAEDGYASAAPLLANAVATFKSANSPFEALATSELGTAAYAAGKPDDADAIFKPALVQARAANYLYVAGRASWMLGLTAFYRAQFADAQAHYEDMLDTFQRMNDVEQVARAHGLLAGVSYSYGDAAAAWQHQLIAFRALSISSSPQLKYQLVMSAAFSLKGADPETALSIQDIALQLARGMNRSANLADILTQRAGTLLTLGRRAEAADSLGKAREELPRIPDAQFRRLLESSLLATESDLNRSSDPSLAVNEATEALRIVEARKLRVRIAQVNLKLAKANIALGRVADAEAALNNGIRAFDADRAASAASSDEGHLASNDESWQLFETAVHLALKKGDLPTAFAMAERARVRTLAEARRQPAPRTLKDVEASLDKDEAIVALNQFDDELAIWLIKNSGTSVITRPLSRVDADRLIARQRDEIRLESGKPEASAALYNEILRPVQAGLGGVARVVLVPDAGYQDLAFAGLWDASRRRFLVEDVSLSLAPSASALVGRASGGAPAGAALIVGGPEANSDSDAKMIASAYPSAQLLDGNAATTSALFASAQGRPVIHVAARMSDNEAYPLLSRLTLADEPGHRYSGVVLGRDIATHSFDNTRLVVLSDSDTSDQSDETRGTLNVARAFLAAGVPNVLGTLPGMDETQSRDLIVSFHRRMSTSASPAEALTTLQRSVLGTNGRRVGAWCALVLYGSDR